MCEGEAAADLEVLTPTAGWGEKESMAGVQMRSAVLKRTDWTASGALDWGFPHSYPSPLHMHGQDGSDKLHQKLLSSGYGALRARMGACGY